MNRLNRASQIQVVRCLVEGNSLRATTRITGVHRTTCMKLLSDLGKACSEYQDKALRNLNCKTIQCDEIWSFVYSKEKNTTEENRNAVGAGDIWTWTAIDPETKLVPSWHVGGRDAGSAWFFMHDLSSRLSNRVQLTTDGHKAYLEAVENAFGTEIDYAMLVKMYGEDPSNEKRYSPAEYIGTKLKTISGTPDPIMASTSIIERNNLTMRMSMRRFTRLTNAFSKKLENHVHAISLHFMHYNFCRIHKSLRVTPAMEAGITDHIWEISELLDLLEN
ncbi:MAG: IS1 family transposase [Opitutales bacterium]|nr:IS1 family transposase [Opitutales bacterium]